MPSSSRLTPDMASRALEEIGQDVYRSVRIVSVKLYVESHFAHEPGEKLIQASTNMTSEVSSVASL